MTYHAYYAATHGKVGFLPCKVMCLFNSIDDELNDSEYNLQLIGKYAKFEKRSEKVNTFETQNDII